MDRDEALDLVRGACIVSMVIAHVAATSLIYKVSHALIWVDGSMGFVLLSGLVLGIVHRRRTCLDSSFRTTAGSIARRIRLLWILNFLLTLLALTLGTVAPGTADLPSFEEHGWSGSIIRAATLALNPPLSILAMYVILLTAALGGIWLLCRGWTLALFVASATLYGTWFILRFNTSLPGQGSDQAFQLAAWQFLFMIGLILGWHWERLHLRRRIVVPSIVLPAATVAVVCAVLADLTVRRDFFVGTSADLILRAFFDKLALGPGAIIFALAVVIVAYKFADSIVGVAPTVLRPLRQIGQRSLDSYVISTVAAMSLPSVLRYNISGLMGQMLAILTLLACYIWARYKLRQRDVVNSRTS